MYCITDQQIEYILNDIRRRGVEMEDLQLNLLDHICCIIEQELEDDGDFERFYEHTVRQFYKKDLGEIEEETINLLTHKNFYQMKKIMIYSGIYTVAAFILGSFFKLMYWPGAAVLLCSAIFAFSLVFLPTVCRLKIKETGNERDKWIMAGATVLGALYCIGTLFMLQRWPGARIIWLGTLGLTFIAFLPAYFFTGIRKPEARVNTIVTTVMLLGFLGLQFALTAMRPSPEAHARVYTYLQSEQLLERAQMGNTTMDKYAADINLTCNKLKAAILQQDIGMSYIPADFESRNISFHERNIQPFFAAGEGQRLLKSLRSQVSSYNEQSPHKIPVERTILEPHFLNKPFCGDFFVLNNIAQLQLYLAAAGNTGGQRGTKEVVFKE